MTTVNKTKPTDVYIAYAGGNPGFGVSVALWSPEHGCCKAISRFIEHGTSNSGCLEAVADVLAYFDGEPVLIHTNHGYITGNLKHLPRWAEGDWQATAGGAPIKNVDQWRRIYEHPGYLVTGR
jgi:ribonuclease HI